MPIVLSAGEDTLPVEAWVAEVRKCWEGQDWTAAEQSLFISDRLMGNAKAEVEFHPEPKRATPTQIFASLTVHFRHSHSYVRTLVQFCRRHQRTDESVREIPAGEEELGLRAGASESPEDGPSTWRLVWRTRERRPQERGLDPGGGEEEAPVRRGGATEASGQRCETVESGPAAEDPQVEGGVPQPGPLEGPSRGGEGVEAGPRWSTRTMVGQHFSRHHMPCLVLPDSTPAGTAGSQGGGECDGNGPVTGLGRAGNQWERCSRRFPPAARPEVGGAPSLKTAAGDMVAEDPATAGGSVGAVGPGRDGPHQARL